MTVSLTESGKSYAEDLLKPLYEIEADVFHKLNSSEQKIAGHLEKIVRFLRETED